MKISRKKVLAYMFIPAFIGCILTHYLESMEDPIFQRIREWVYFRNTPKSESPEIDYFPGEGAVVSPMAVAQTALYDAQEILGRKYGYLPEQPILKRNPDKEIIIRAADFFLSYAEKKQFEDIAFILYPYNWRFSNSGRYDRYKLLSPWYSGLCQGLAAQILLAAYELTGNEAYYNGAVLSLNSLKIETKDGGVTKRLTEDASWFEEYVSIYTDESPFVLNGHIFVLDALYWMKEHYDPSWETLYRSGVNAVVNRLPEYDSGVWSYYARDKLMATRGYHNIHIEQLKRLYVINQNNIFKKYYMKFQFYAIIPFGVFQRLIVMHNNMLLAEILGNTIFVYFILLMYNIIPLIFRRFKRQG